jgi:hypothetical protein
MKFGAILSDGIYILGPQNPSNKIKTDRKRAFAAYGLCATLVFLNFQADRPDAQSLNSGQAPCA